MFEKSSPEQQRMDGGMLDAFRKKLKGEKILGCIIIKKDNIIFEFYKNNKIQPETHHINSCTKSILSALFGICLDKGFIKAVDTPITEYFGDLVGRQADERKKKITLYHLLTMSAGFDWPEFGEWHYFAPMRYSSNIVKYILDRELASDPGTSMNYNSGCSHLLAAVIQQATGAKAAEFAGRYLFQPLGIAETHWYEIQGINLGADGLNFKLADLAKFGYLYLHKGNWFGKEIVSEKWVAESTASRFLTYRDIGGYGYQWWSSVSQDHDGTDVPYYFAMGFGGQYCIVVPGYDMVVAFVSRDYTDTLLPMRLFREYVIKAHKH